MIIQYKKLNLENAEKIRKWRNNQINILRQNKIITKSEQINYFKNFILKKNPKSKLFGINCDQEFIGYGGLVNISKVFKTAEISFILNNVIKHNSIYYEKILSDFLSFIKIYAFKKKKLRKLYTETYSFRKKHIKVLENNKLKLEGVLKKHIIKNNKVYDSLFHGILRF